MPTPLPARRPFWRRHALAPDVSRNLVSTAMEFGLAFFVVGMTVFVVARLNGVV